MEKEDILLRKLALETVICVNKSEEFLHIAMKNVLDKYDYLDAGQKAFIKRLVSGTIENRIKLDYCISIYSKVRLNKLKPPVRAILEMGIYQILYMDNVFDTKACNLSVELAKKKGLGNLSGYVNGILRAVARDKNTIEFPKREDDINRYLSIEYSMPEFLTEMFIKQYGEETTEKILSASIEKSELYIRLCGDKQTRDELLKTWDVKGIDYVKSDCLDYACIVKGSSISELPGFEEGLFNVQNLSSMMIGELAPVKDDYYVIDVCAAPGGKSAHIAERLNNTGRVVACDIIESKIDIISQNMDRLRLTNVEPMCIDATEYREEFAAKADIVLADVPCSGLGVIGRKPDIKYRLNEDNLNELVILQRRIIDNVVKYVKDGGYFIYSTCTLNQRENEENVKYILDKYNFNIVNDIKLPEKLNAEIKEGMIKTIQGISRTDGFFITIMKKVQIND